MIVAENNKPTIEEFKKLMHDTDTLLNQEAKGREEYFAHRNGTALESDVYDALRRCSTKTPFENTISLVSGASFPDIVAHKFYGIEVKSTNKNHWKSIGSSILESTRDQNVERIFLTFGKLGKPISFCSRPYEECLAGISVTHYPRYQIDMNLKEGNTIFDKMGISYDELRKMDNPVLPVSQYYKSKLKQGESLWWASNGNVEETTAPPLVRLWSSLSSEQKNYYTVLGYSFFPEILSQGTTTKYQHYALWLATNCGVINTNIRDQFSAGGKVTINTINGTFERMPAAFGKINKNRELIERCISNADIDELREHWQTSNVSENRIKQWCHIVASVASGKETYTNILNMLYSIFLIK